MIKKIHEMIYGRQYDLRERIFRMIILVGGIQAVLGIVECLIVMDVKIIVIPLVLLLVVLGIGLLATFKYRKIDFAAMVVGFLIILIVFPEMFFLSGGLDGGATIWFALGLLYVFLMFSGKKLAFFLILSIITDALTYTYGYFHRESITPMNSMAAAYIDSFFAMLAVGLAGGIILKVQMQMFDTERSIAQKQQEELEVMSDSKNRFFASMSHEIRTPINTIIGLNEMILRESEEDGTKKYARNIQNASKMLLDLVNEILDLSQIEMKKMEIVPLEYRIVELFDSLIDMLQVRLKEKKLELLVDIDENIPSVVLGDMKRIYQVLLNILTNAVKYTETGSVTFSAHVENMEEDQLSLKISVADTGIGIRKEDLEHLYDAFKRIDARKNLKVEGSGLGLSITKQLVDMMGGKITVDSIYTKGSVFTVTLPQKIVDNSPIGSIDFLSRNKGGEEEYQQSFEAPEARILIVDDNDMNSMVASKLLEATKVKIDIAKDGEQCLYMTRRKYYHVILMDYMMPEMDGGQVLKQLRKQENGLCRDSAVIVLSANSGAETGKIYLEEGFDGYLEKPIQGKDLEEEILKFIPEDIIEYRQPEQETENPANIQKISHNRKKKIYITTDCVSDLPENLVEKYDIGIMYLYIKTDKGRFADTWEISSDYLKQYVMDTDNQVMPDGVSVEEYEEFFAEALTKSEQVIHISMAKNIGQSYETAVTAAQGFDHVSVIDSAQISCGQALVVLYAAKLVVEGYSADIICENIEKMKKQIETRFIMPSAKYFYKTGRTSKVTAKICGFFGLHPVLTLHQSKMTIIGVEVGNLENAWRRFIRGRFLRKGKINTDIIFVSQVGCSVMQQNIIRNEITHRIPFKQVIMQRASVSIACCSGTEAFGFAYYVK